MRRRRKRMITAGSDPMLLRPLHRLLENPHVYRASQFLGLPTIQRFRGLIRKHVPQDRRRKVLEIGCGVGSYRPYFECEYTGIDINADCIRVAARHFDGRFEVMDAAQMSFAPGSFDDAVSIATTHHLSDGQLGAMIEQATTAASTLHIIDAILPLSPHAWFKTAWFRTDRGRHVRSFEQLRDVVGQNAQVAAHEILTGPLHDVCYIQASRPVAPGAAGGGK
jgi:SAM-dependent methyltransferase